jgi:hypothetical protein
VSTFALLLLAYPFYLAVNGRLTVYTSLASSAATAATASSSAPAASNTPTAPVQPAPAVAASANTTPASVAGQTDVDSASPAISV